MFLDQGDTGSDKKRYAFTRTVKAGPCETAVSRLEIDVAEQADIGDTAEQFDRKFGEAP